MRGMAKTIAEFDAPSTTHRRFGGIGLRQASQAFYRQGGNQLLFLGGETGYVEK